MSATQRAMSLALAGQSAEGLAILRAAEASDDPAAYLLEGLWKLEGRFVAADAVGARALLRRAADLGHVAAARTLAGLVACGIGGRSDWPAALALIGDWSDRDPVAARQLELISAMGLDTDGVPDTSPAQCLVNADPKIARVDGLFTPGECAFLIELADPRMRRATIFHQTEQRFVEDDVRRSDKAGFPIVSEWPFVRAINRRIAAATCTQIECGEALQVLRYAPTQEYRPHFDAIAGMDNPRVMTALVWLNDDYSGGETRFDELNMSQRGRAGDLLLFANTRSDGSPDLRTRHSGLPVTSGIKHMASRWIRARPPGPRGFGRHEVETRLAQQ